jgi:predicted chitinase
MNTTLQNVQRRLLALGFPLPKYGPDGNLGGETFEALDAALDELEERRGAVREAQATPRPLIDRSAFFAHIRRSELFPNGLSQNQVNGLENLLGVWEKYLADEPLAHLAYNLATAYHETAATMQPIKERGARSYFDKYEPGTKLGKLLGNTEVGDGYRFRGEGHVQNTGRRNAQVATDRLNEKFGLGIDMVADPALRGDPLISALSLFLGNAEGWWTGKDLYDFIDNIDEDDAEDLREFIAGRRVVNGTDKAEKIGRQALVFEAALKAA